MPYTQFPLSAIIAAEQQWIRHRVINDLVTDLMTLNFSVVIQRTEAISAISAAMRQPNIDIGSTVRFPDGIYVTLGDQALYNLLTEIINVLSYRDMQKDTADTMRNISGKAAVESNKDQQVGWHYNDAAISFTRKLQNLRTYISDTRHVWSQPTFESFHNLTWQAP